MILKLKLTPGIYLVGFMGCGKTTVGQALADELGWSFFDLDEDIEKAAGCSIASIFDTRGEAAFREMETAALKKRIASVRMGLLYIPWQRVYGFIDVNNADVGGSVSEAMHAVSRRRI